MRLIRYGLVWAFAIACAAIVPAHAQPQKGKAIFDAKCVECHGISGKGDGPAAVLLTPRPRDFTTGKYKIRTTESGTGPTDDDLIQSVRQGLYGTAMPAGIEFLLTTKSATWSRTSKEWRRSCRSRSRWC